MPWGIGVPGVTQPLGTPGYNLSPYVETDQQNQLSRFLEKGATLLETTQERVRRLRYALEPAGPEFSSDPFNQGAPTFVSGGGVNVQAILPALLVFGALVFLLPLIVRRG